MKLSLTILLCLTTTGFAQTAAVTKNPNTNQLASDLVMPSGRTLQVDGTLQTGQSPVLFGRSIADVWAGVPAFVSILSSGTEHGLISRTTGSAGMAIVGISETGAAAAKFTQRYNFNSPTLYVNRDPDTFNYGNPPTSPTLVVSTPNSNAATPIALFKRNIGDVVMSIGSDGSIIANWDQQYHNSYNPLSLTTANYVNTNFVRTSGVTDGSSATSGRIGEYLEGAGASALATASARSIGALALTPGDWDVSGVVTYTKASGTTVTLTQQGISLDSTALGGPGSLTATAANMGVAGPSSFSTPTVRINIAYHSLVYLVVQASFSTSSLNASGFIRARRVR